MPSPQMTIDCYVRTPEDYHEIFTGYVGQTVRLSAIVKEIVIPNLVIIPRSGVDVKFYKNNVYYATSKTRKDGWADGDTTLTSGDVGSITWKVEAWWGGKKVKSAVSDAPFTVTEAPPPPTPPAPPEAPPSKTLAARMLPFPLLLAKLWSLRTKFVREDVHRKIHPII